METCGAGTRQQHVDAGHIALQCALHPLTCDAQHPVFTIQPTNTFVHCI